MFLQILGWIVIAVILGKLTLLYLLVMANGLGKYNIGGVPNGFSKKLLIVAGMFVVGYLWYLMYQNFPYEFVPKNVEVVKKVG